MSRLEYPLAVRPLSTEDGGGYLVEFPDLPGCMSDGETVEEAIRNGAEAVRDWIAAICFTYVATEFEHIVVRPAREQSYGLSLQSL